MQYSVPLRVIVSLQPEYVRRVDNDEDEEEEEVEEDDDEVEGPAVVVLDEGEIVVLTCAECK